MADAAFLALLLVGLACVAVGCFLVAAPLGLIVTGGLAAVLAVGYSRGDNP